MSFELPGEKAKQQPTETMTFFDGVKDAFGYMFKENGWTSSRADAVLFSANSLKGDEAMERAYADL